MSPSDSPVFKNSFKNELGFAVAVAVFWREMRSSKINSDSLSYGFQLRDSLRSYSQDTTIRRFGAIKNGINW